MAKKIKIGLLILILSCYFMFTLRTQSHFKIGKLNNDNSENLKRSICVGIEDTVSWWPGDGNAFDIIGENHGKMMNGTSFTSGKVGHVI